jgi:polygalacturonase
MNYDPIDFGAFADGVNDDTLAIRRAIEKAHLNKGTVVFSTNRVYRSGMIELLDNTTLCLEEGSKLMMTDEVK